MRSLMFAQHGQKKRAAAVHRVHAWSIQHRRFEFLALRVAVTINVLVRANPAAWAPG